MAETMTLANTIEQGAPWTGEIVKAMEFYSCENPYKSLVAALRRAAELIKEGK